MGRLYDLRHTYASKLASDTNASITVISRLLGHSDIKMTMHYISDLSDAMRNTATLAENVINVKI